MPEYEPQIDYDPGLVNELLLKDANLGKDCEVFWSSPVGTYIRERAEKEINFLMKELYEADPDDRKAQREIRQDINLRRLMLEYLSEQIQGGTNARIQLEEDSD